MLGSFDLVVTELCGLSDFLCSCFVFVRLKLVLSLSIVCIEHELRWVLRCLCVGTGFGLIVVFFLCVSKPLDVFAKNVTILV